MPELPEVAPVKKTLLPYVTNCKIIDIDVYLPRLIKYPSPDLFIENLLGKKIEDIRRKGKYLVFVFSDSEMIVHLRMTGSLVAQKTDLPMPNYAKIKFELDNNFTLWFCDIRTFGTLYLMDKTSDYRIEGYETLGPEPLSSEFTIEYLTMKVNKSSKPIKTLILEQKIIAGLGNIYADECLALASISPFRSANSLTSDEINNLHDAINSVISNAKIK